MIDARQTKNDVKYQATPRARMRCEICVNCVERGMCRAVKGPIVDQGWCEAYEGKRQKAD